MICYLCHTEEESIFYKICNCNSSLLCKDCFFETNQQEEVNTKCPLCRKNLNLEYKLNFFKFVKKFFKINIYFIILFILKISLPIVIYLVDDKYPNEIYSSPNLFLISSLVVVLFMGEINKELFFYPGFEINDNLSPQQKLNFTIYLDVILYIINITYYVLFFTLKPKKFSLYYCILVIIPCHIVPFVILCSILMLLKIKKDLDKMIKDNSYKKLKILQVVYNNQSEV